MRVQGSGFVAHLVLSYPAVIDINRRFEFALGLNWSGVMCRIIDRGWTFGLVPQFPSRRAPARRHRSLLTAGTIRDFFGSEPLAKPGRIRRPRWWRSPTLFLWLGDAYMWGLFEGWSGLEIRTVPDNDSRPEDDRLGDDPPKPAL
jgi:hypothetical protein